MIDMTGPSFFAPTGDIYAPFSNSFLVYGSVRPPPPNNRPPPAYQRPIPIPQPLDLPTPVTHRAPSYGTIDPSRIPYIIPRTVPGQAPTSLPSYCPLPQSSEAIFLLAPPPRYCRCEAENQVHNLCDRRARDNRLGDAIVTLLIVLNVLVWTAVIWGLCIEWEPITIGGFEDLGGVVFGY
jgi:hypothetical protein